MCDWLGAHNYTGKHNNNVLDSGEDSAEFFNADGSFLAGLRYSVYLELEARDRDDDGKGDFVKFADNAVIKLTSQGNAQMTGNQNGAVYKFPAAAMPAKAVTTDPGQVTIELQEGYTGRPIETINVTSVGTTTVTSIVAVADDDTLIDVSYDGMTVYVLPADYGLAVGRYSTVIYIQNEYGGVYTTIPVTINVGEAVVTHTVTFKVDASAVDTKTVESGKTVTAPADPSQTGKKFVGWYTDGNVKFDFATPITGDLTLNAKFEDAVTTLTGTTTDGIKVTVENLKGSATLIVAQYEGGKMVDVQMQTVSADNTYGFAGLTHKTGCTYKAFLVNSTSYAPLCAADEF